MKALVFSAFILDQVCKYWINQNLNEGEKRKMTPRLNITNVKNKGMAFGAFAGSRKLLLTFSVLGTLATWYEYNRASPREKLGVALMAGGGLSNVYDRIVKGEVTDYIYIESKRPAPVFNFADIFVFVGCLITLLGRVHQKNGRYFHTKST